MAFGRWDVDARFRIEDDLIADRDLAARRSFKARDHAESGGFATARRTQEGDEGVVFHDQVEVIDGVEAAVAFANVLQYDLWHNYFPPMPLSSDAPVRIFVKKLTKRMTTMMMRLMPFESP